MVLSAQHCHFYVKDNDTKRVSKTFFYYNIANDPDELQLITKLNVSEEMVMSYGRAKFLERRLKMVLDH